MTRRIRLAFLPAALAAAAFAPDALAADPVSPADGARVSLKPEFVVRMAPDETIARVFVATQPNANADGFTSGFVSYCTPSAGSDPSLASCRLGLDLRPGTYYWLIRFYGSSGWRVSQPRRFVASAKAAAPAPPKPKPGKPGKPAPTGSLPRPADGMGEFGYTVPEAPPFAGARTVVHYVTTGLDAPPLNDDDADGTPEYVEEVAAAADAALAHYASAGFREPLPDAAGPDTRVDVYVKDFEDPQLLGIAVPHARARGGAFTVISSRLDRSPKLAYGSLPAVVAHELFHIVQYAYLPDGRMPRWVAEGTATTMALEVFPKITDFVALEYLDLWLREPWRSLHDQRFYCDRCYGGAWWWGTLSENDPRLLPEYFERLAAYGEAKRPIRLGLKALGEVFRRHGLTLGQAFAGFSLGLYKAGMSPSLAYGLKAGARTQRTRVHRINGLATHYVGLRAPGGARRLVVHVEVRRSQLAGSLAVGGPKGRLVFSRNGTFTVHLRSARERRRLVLVLTSPASAGAAYRISYRAV